MPITVRVEDVSKRFKLHYERSIKERILHIGRAKTEEFWALRDLSFELEQSQTLGLIGPNGSGKSTLLSLIAGILVPTTGYIERRGRVAALLELGAGFHPDLTGRENVFMNASILGLTRRQTEAYFDSIVDFSGIERFIDTQVKFYSSGMYIRLAFAVAVHVEPELLLIDEVLAVGDEPFQRKCMDRIKQFQKEGRTIIFVTHGLDLVRQLCDRVIMLDQGEPVIDGKPLDALREFRDRFAFDEEGEEDEVGSREIEIEKVVVADGAGQPRDRFAPGDDICIEIDYDAKRTIEDPVFGIAILDHLDNLVYGTNSVLRGDMIDSVHGEGRVRFLLRSVPMVEGNYALTVAVHSRDEAEQYHRLERCSAFNVRSPSDDPGVVYMDTVFEEMESHP